MTLISRFVFFHENKTRKMTSPAIAIKEISIVIPVKDNPRGIDRYLNSFFSTQDDNNFPKEIIIIDNNSTSKLQIDSRYFQKGLSIHVLSCFKKGPAAARNLGVAKAKGKWILFNDSDCILTSNSLIGYLSACDGSVAYAGNIRAWGQDKLSKYYESQEILLPLKTHNSTGQFVPQYLITANCIVWKHAFESVDGFNEEISVAGGEDIDLGLRLSQVGNLSYALNSIVLHDFNKGWLTFYRRFFRYGYGNRMIEEIWKTKMNPVLFPPNDRGAFNEIAAKLQFLALLLGYNKAQRKLSSLKRTTIAVANTKKYYNESRTI